jgi:hypothetical protein
MNRTPPETTPESWSVPTEPPASRRRKSRHPVQWVEIVSDPCLGWPAAGRLHPAQRSEGEMAMGQILRIARSAGRYTVLNEDGAVLTSHTGRAAAISAAIAHLHAGMGGEVVVISESGGISSRVPVVGSHGKTPREPATQGSGTVGNPDVPPSRASEGAAAPEPPTAFRPALQWRHQVCLLAAGARRPRPSLPTRERTCAIPTSPRTRGASLRRDPGSPMTAVQPLDHA